MDLRPYVENINQQLAAAAEAGGDDARALAERLAAPLEAAIRLALQDVLSAAAEEITTELAPGSVELRLRGRDPEFVVTQPPAAVRGDGRSDGDLDDSAESRSATRATPPAPGQTDDSAMSRINLRMPDRLKARVEEAAGTEGLSVNTWLVRAATAALERGDADNRREPRGPWSAQRYTGWAR